MMKSRLSKTKNLIQKHKEILNPKRPNQRWQRQKKLNQKKLYRNNQKKHRPNRKKYLIKRLRLSRKNRNLRRKKKALRQATQTLIQQTNNNLSPVLLVLWVKQWWKRWKTSRCMTYLRQTLNCQKRFPQWSRRTESAQSSKNWRIFSSKRSTNTIKSKCKLKLCRKTASIM